MSTTSSSIELDGVRIDAHSRESLLKRFTESLWIPSDELYVGFYASLLWRTKLDDSYRRQLLEAACVYADGAGTSLAIGVLSPKSPRERLATTDLWADMVALTADLEVPVAVICGTSDVAERFSSHISSIGANVVYARSGYFDDAADRIEAAAEVRRSGAGLVLVGMGSGVQESFCTEIREADDSRAQTFVTVGGLADHVVGSTVRAPLVVQRSGLEWLWRVAQEPRRLFLRYAVGNSYFLARLFLAAMPIRRTVE